MRKRRPRKGKGLPMTPWHLGVTFAVTLRHPLGSSAEPVLWRPISQEPGDPSSQESLTQTQMEHQSEQAPHVMLLRTKGCTNDSPFSGDPRSRQASAQGSPERRGRWKHSLRLTRGSTEIPHN